ncbi:long-chain fatty acid--CoA ligase [Mycobacterium sp. URHB0044]|jgi:long-chain acyl-CoA synthetase|uniref:AMP-dependent synthetase/ligase n=1 Tax=Mycobacterium sp. URHB0044 TaxID=1380386 RepID=UPI00048D2CB6|nr:AMP-dependent synthetase/ligase [Mycobacterium sp. URHB0044]
MSSVDARTATTLGETFLATVATRGAAPAICNADGQTVLSWHEYGEQARRAAAGLSALGLGHQQTIGLLLANRPEFYLVDTAALLLGAVPFSMYNTSAPEQLVHLLSDAGCRIIVTEAALLPALAAALEQRQGAVEHVVVVDSPSWSELFASGQIDQAAAVGPDDLATLIYTSGTTGPPKGVQLTHGNILAMTTEVAVRLEVQPHYRVISHLPLAHIADRLCSHYLPLAVGNSVVCCPQPSQVIELLPRVQPEVFFSPPRLWEKLRNLIAAELEDGGDRHEVLRRLGFGNLEVAVVGAAPCSPELAEFYADVGIPLLEVYGLSETVGVISQSTAQDNRPGAAGRPLDSYEVRLADDDELLVRGPMVMAGYRNRPEATAEAIDADGWLHTGDIARIAPDGQLQIVGRKKELIINASGKNMSPNNIEACLKESGPLIAEACVVGNARPYNVALIVPEAGLASSYRTAAELRQAVQGCVEIANARMSRVEQIKRFAILPDPWVPNSDELTPTMKLKRGSIESKYAAHIEALYAGKDTP